MHRREFLLATPGVAAAGLVGRPRGELAATTARSDASAADTLAENGSVQYESASQRFRYTLDYEIPSNISELTIEIAALEGDEVSVLETRGVTRESETSFVWRDGPAPQVVVGRRVGGGTSAAGVSGSYAAGDIALGSRIRTRLPFRYSGSPPSRRRTLTFEGEGFVGGAYVYAGPHEAYSRTVDGTRLAIVVPEPVQPTIPHGALLDAYELGERTIPRRLPREQMTAFVVPPDWSDRRGFAVGADVVVQPASARVEHIGSVATHEYVHTSFGVFGGGEMYWLKEAVAEYYGYLLALNAGAGTFAEFVQAARAIRYSDAVLADAERMRQTTADYDKGAHVLAALDAEIQQTSSGNATLGDALTTGDHDLTRYDGFEAAVEAAAGSSRLTDWLDLYVRSSAVPAIPDDPRYYLLGDRTVDSLQTATQTATETRRATETPAATGTPTGTAGPWRTATANDASVETGQGSVTIRVHKCSSGSATKTLGSGSTTVAFEYEIEAEGWWERPYCEILEDGESIWVGSVGDDEHYDEKIFDISPGRTTTGRVRKTFDRTGPLQVRLGVTRSEYCSSGDHGTTWFRVRNFQPRSSTAATAGPPATDTAESTATAVQPPTSESASTPSTAEPPAATAVDGPGLGVVSALASLGGAGYLLNRRLDGADDQ